MAPHFHDDPAPLPTQSRGRPGGRRIVHQVWHWQGEEQPALHIYITIQDGETWRVHHFQSRCRARRRDRLTDLFAAAGLVGGRWLATEESGYYQPIFVGRRAGSVARKMGARKNRVTAFSTVPE